MQPLPRFGSGPVIPGPIGMRLVLPLLLGVLLVGADALPARALDLFTLWRQPELPLRIQEGAWADYRSTVMTGGRREESLVRIMCLDRSEGSDDDSWLVELLYLDELRDGTFVPVSGEGTRLRISRELAERKGALLDHVIAVERWQDGRPDTISPAELREDPLVAASLTSEFAPDEVTRTGQTTRVVRGHQLLCDQFLLAAADSQQARLPAGTVIQLDSWEITAAVNEEVPFLGLAFVSERVRSESRLDPPNRRMQLPPARVRVERMELMAYGADAKSVLRRSD